MARYQNPLKRSSRQVKSFVDKDAGAGDRWKEWVELLEPTDPMWEQTNEYADLNDLWDRAKTPGILLASAHGVWPHRFIAQDVLQLRKEWMRELLLGDKDKGDYVKILHRYLPPQLAVEFETLAINFPSRQKELIELNTKRKVLGTANTQALRLRGILKPLDANAAWHNELACHLAGWQVLALAIAPLSQSGEHNYNSLLKYGQALQKLSLRLDNYLPADNPAQKRQLQEHINTSLHPKIIKVIKKIMPAI